MGLESLGGLLSALEAIGECVSFQFQKCAETLAGVGALAYALVTDPLGTIAAIGNGIWQPIQDDWNAGNHGEAIGRSTGIILELIFGGKGLDRLRMPGKTPQVANGGLGDLIRVNAKDPDADALADRIGGRPSVHFANDPKGREVDAVSDQYIAQTKPANFTLNKHFRDQAKATFEFALQTGRTPYFHFNGAPGPGVLEVLRRYASRYGIEPVIDLTPFGG